MSGHVEIPDIQYVRDVFDELSWRNIDSPEKEEVSENLELILDDLNLMREKYYAPGPDGTEGAQEVMLEVLNHLFDSVSRLLNYLETGDEEEMDRGQEGLESADLLLESLGSVIAQFRLELAELLSRLKNGELEEGQPVLEEDETELISGDEEIDSAQENTVSERDKLPEKSRDTADLSDVEIHDPETGGTYFREA